MVSSREGEPDAVAGGSDEHATNRAPGETKSVESKASFNTSVVEGVAAHNIACSHKRGSKGDAEQCPGGGQSGDSASKSAAESEQSGCHAAKHEEQADEVEGKGEAGEVVVSSMVVQELCWDVLRGAEVSLR